MAILSDVSGDTTVTAVGRRRKAGTTGGREAKRRATERRATKARAAARRMDEAYTISSFIYSFITNTKETTIKTYVHTSCYH